MPTVALQLTEELIAALTAMAGVEVPEMFDNVTYATVEFHSPKEFHVTFMSDDEIFHAAATNPDIQIVTA